MRELRVLKLLKQENIVQLRYCTSKRCKLAVKSKLMAAPQTRTQGLFEKATARVLF